MAKFRYTALDAAGNRTSGVADAASSEALANRLQRQRFFLLRADPVGEGNRLTGIFNLDLQLERGLSKSIVAAFTRELAVMLSSGQDVDHALRFLVDTTENVRACAILQRLRDQVRGGKSLAMALSGHPRVFSKLYVSLVRAGETGGKLAEGLTRLADLLDREMRLQASIHSALIYPAFLALVSIATIVLLLTYVLPQFTAIFAQAGAQLPLATRILITIGDVLRDYGTVLLALMLIGALLLQRALRQDRVRLALESFVLRLPLVGSLIKRVQAARFSRTLGTLLRDGVGLVPALAIAETVLGSITAARLVDTARVRVRSGGRLAASLAEGGFFPAQTIHLLRLGEETGRLGEMALRAGDIHDEQVQHTVNRMVALLVPAVTITMGLVVAGIVGSLLVAMLSLNDLAL